MSYTVDYEAAELARQGEEYAMTYAMTDDDDQIHKKESKRDRDDSDYFPSGSQDSADNEYPNSASQMSSPSDGDGDSQTIYNSSQEFVSSQSSYSGDADADMETDNASSTFRRYYQFPQDVLDGPTLRQIARARSVWYHNANGGGSVDAYISMVQEFITGLDYIQFNVVHRIITDNAILRERAFELTEEDDDWIVHLAGDQWQLQTENL